MNFTRLDQTNLNRALIGFDRLFSDLESRFASQTNQNYPPFNIIKRSEDEYEIQVAVAGFKQSEIDITTENNELRIQGTKDDKVEDVGEYLHRGLAARNFERWFTLGQYLEVTQAEIADGVLVVKLVRNVPEIMKPKKIAISRVI